MRMILKSMTAGALVALGTLGVPAAANAVVCGTTGVADTLALVVGLGSCTVEDKTFTFNSASFSAPTFGLTPGAVGVLGLPSTGALNTNPGIQFNGAFLNSSATNPADATITFGVIAQGGSLIDDASLVVAGIVSGTVFSDSETLTRAARRVPLRPTTKPGESPILTC